MAGLRGLIAAGVRNPVFANMLMVSLLAGGAFSARFLVTETYPEFSLDRISIETEYPGASPVEVEQSVNTKIEEAIEGLPGIKKIWSQAVPNGGLVMVELRDGADARLLMLDLKDRVDRIDHFPADVRRPVIAEVLARGQVINVAIHGDAPERTIHEVAAEVKDELLAHEVISQVELSGIRDYEIAIHVSQEALVQYGLSLEEISALIAKNSLDIPAGILRTRNEELILRTTGQRYTAQDFQNIVVIAQPDGTLVRLGQIADITDGFEEDFKSAKFQGEPAAMIEVFKTADQDTSTIAAAVRDYVARKSEALPDKLRIDVWADSSREVIGRFNMLLQNAALGMLLVVIVLSLFLDVRVSLYVALGVPVSFAGALVVMTLTGQTLNMISLFGLIMVTGIIVDDAIVIADSYRSYVAAGESPVMAATDGPTAVFIPVVASSVTTILAFLPLLFVVGIMGKVIAVMPVVVISAIVFSSIEAFFILPSHLQHCLVNAEGTKSPPSRWRSHVEARIERFVQHRYLPLLQWAIGSRYLTICGAAACLLFTIGLIAGGRTLFTLLPEIDGDTLRVRVQLPQGLPVARTEQAVRQLEAAAKRLNDPNVLSHGSHGDLVLKTSSVVGEWSGWIKQRGSHLGEVMIELMPAEARHLDGEAILAAWAEQTGTIQDAVSLTFSRAQPGPAEKPLDIRLLGDDLDQLRLAADEVVKKLTDFAGVSEIEHDLQPGKREVRVQLKPSARTLGVTLDDLARQLRSGFYGGEALRIQRGRNEVRVQVRYPDDQRQRISDIENMRITGMAGRDIPFRELATFQIRRGLAAIRHQDGRRRVRITADVDPRLANAERILAEVDAGFLTELASKYPDITYRLEGQHAQMLESLRSLFWASGLAMICIYALLAGTLGSYAQPVVIMAAIPLGFVGAVLGHFVTGYDLTILSIFGMVALSGVVVNDSLVLLDRIRQRLAGGGPLEQAILDAGRDRFRAVILTTITTIAGLAPLLLERSTQAQSLIPMAISLTFGLAAATVLTLLVVPALVWVISDLNRFVRWLWHGGDLPTTESIPRPRESSSIESTN